MAAGTQSVARVQQQQRRAAVECVWRGLGCPLHAGVNTSVQVWAARGGVGWGVHGCRAAQPPGRGGACACVRAGVGVGGLALMIVLR
jgi:hypothetical protein